MRLPADAVLPEVAGMRGPLSCLDEARFGICWGAVGAGRACYEAALEYAKTRVQYGRPIGGFQLTQRKLVNMMLELQKAQLLAWRLGRLKDAGERDPRQISRQAQQRARGAEVAREARTILGANGITLEYPVMRHTNNLESVLTYEGTEEIHTLILGEALTGRARADLIRAVAQAVERDPQDVLGLLRVGGRDLGDPHDHLDDVADVGVGAHDPGLLGALSSGSPAANSAARQLLNSGASRSR